MGYTNWESIQTLSHRDWHVIGRSKTKQLICSARLAWPSTVSWDDYVNMRLFPRSTPISFTRTAAISPIHHRIVVLADITIDNFWQKVNILYLWLIILIISERRFHHSKKFFFAFSEVLYLVLLYYLWLFVNFWYIFIKSDFF